MLRVGGFLRRVPVTSDDEIGELAVAFNNMAASLSSSEGTRRSFIANVSHELKTPHDYHRRLYRRDSGRHDPAR